MDTSRPSPARAPVAGPTRRRRTVGARLVMLLGAAVRAAAVTAVAVMAHRAYVAHARPEVTLPAASTSASFTATPTEVAMAVAVLTEPDSGPAGTTVRFDGSTVSYRLDVDYPDGYLAEVRAAFAWVGEVTGLTVVETTGEADIVVVPRDDNGARTELWPDAQGRIDHVVFALGCCRVRAAWEDAVQSFGPVGDRADARSVFSPDVDALDRPSPFDAWVLRLLYSLAPGASADEVRTLAQRSLAPPPG